MFKMRDVIPLAIDVISMNTVHGALYALYGSRLSDSSHCAFAFGENLRDELLADTAEQWKWTLGVCRFHVEVRS